jgi:hypothetical protein
VSGSGGRSPVCSFGILVVLAFPVVFVVGSWLYGGGLPYYKDSNESFLSYVHARNLVIYNPFSFSFLTAEDTSLAGDRPKAIYTHNPNFPRYLNYVLLRLGITSLPVHILLIATAAAALAMFFMWRLLQGLFPGLEHVWIILALAFTLDFMGFLQFTVNSYRVFAFVLFWGCLLAIARNTPPWVVFGAFFLLFQFEYAFAVFLLATCAVYGVCWGQRGGRRRAFAAVLGAVAAVAVFGLQLLSYYGLQGLMADLSVTFVRRSVGGHLGAPGDVGELVSRYNVVLSSESRYVSLRGTLREAWTHVVQFYNPWVAGMMVWGLASSAVLSAVGMRQYREGGHPELELRLFLSRMVAAMTAGLLVLTALLRGYFVAAYIREFLPLLVFPVAFAIAETGLDLYGCLRAVTAKAVPALVVFARVVAYVVVLLPLVINAPAKVRMFQPLRGDFVGILSSKLAGERFVAPLNFHNLAFALTGGPAGPSPRVPSVESLGPGEGVVHYLCVERPWMGTDCAGAASDLLRRGAMLAYQSPDYVIMKLR